MSWFGNSDCIHNWSVLVKSKTPAVKFTKMHDLSGEEIARLSFGVTTVLVTCSKCGEIERHEMLGQVEQ